MQISQHGYTTITLSSKWCSPLRPILNGAPPGPEPQRSPPSATGGRSEPPCCAKWRWRRATGRTKVRWPVSTPPDDQTPRLQAGAGADDFIHLPRGPDRVACELQEEEEEDSGLFLLVVFYSFLFSPHSAGPVALSGFFSIVMALWTPFSPGQLYTEMMSTGREQSVV